LKTLPYDASLIFDGDTDDKDIFWPVTPTEMRNVINGHLGGLLSLTEQSNDDLHKSTLLMSLTAIAPIWGYCEKALCVQFERNSKVRFASSSGIIPYLRGEGALPEEIGVVSSRISSPVPPNHPLVRSVINTYKMMPWWKIPMAVSFPSDMVGTTNHLLSDYSRSESGTRFYSDANKMLLDIRIASKPEENHEITELVISQMTNLVTGNLELDFPLSDRLKSLIRQHLAPIIRLIIQDLLHAQKSSSIPNSFWGGSGGRYGSRLISLESLRRGGSVVRFDHAGTVGFLKLKELFASLELSASSKYVMASPRHAELTKGTGAGDLVSRIRAVNIVGGPGYSHISNLKLTGNNSAASKPRVMYLSSFSNSEMKSATHYLSQTVYQDWSLRLAKKLSNMPINLISKPHPDFKFPGTSHPLSRYSKVVYSPFEEIIDDADIFVYDCLNSTTFWEVVCSRKKIICIDVGLPEATEESLAILQRRCTMIRTRLDESNRLQISSEELEEAILGTARAGSPDEFRNILIGE
jgi:hypothetical protein